MKQSKRCCAWTALVLAALLALCAPAALAQEAAADVTWDMGAQDVFALEGVTQDNVFILGGGDYTQYGILRTHPDYTGVAVYIFRGDALVMYGENISASMQSVGVVFADIYASLLATLTEEYGEPTLEDPAQALHAANTVEPDSINPEDVLSFAGWELGEGLALYHLHLKGETEESVITIFVNETRLYDAG